MRQVVEAVDSISSVREVDELALLQGLIDHYFASAEAAQHLEVWFRLFERFPSDDAYEMFWSILHGIEDQPGFEPLVVESVRRQPSRFPVMMLNHLLNSGQVVVDGVDLLSLLRSVATDKSCLPIVRQDAHRFAQYQEEHA
jgi:hypothetical protein